jgi:ABC-2 type transport system permease protein
MNPGVTPQCGLLEHLPLGASKQFLYCTLSIKIDNITELFYAFYEAGRYPVTIYRGVVRTLLTFIVPIAFVTTFPASALLGRIDTSTTLIGFAFAIGLFIASSRFWNYAVNHYSSASS